MSKTKYLFLSLLLLSNLANAQAAAGGGAFSTKEILLVILGILIIRLFYKSKSMSAEKLGEKIGKFLASLKGWQWILYPMIIFFAYVFFIDTPNKKSSSSVKEEYVTPSSSSSRSSSSSSSSSSSKTCSWCGNRYTSAGYYHIFDDCTQSEEYGSNCSRSCCMNSWNSKPHKKRVDPTNF